MNLILFYVLAAIIVISAFLVVTLRNVFHSALFLIITFFVVAGVYLMLRAEFLAAVQVLIYVGAVTILMLFAIMLTYQIQSKSIRQTNEQVIPAAIISALFLALAVFAATRTFGNAGPARPNTGSWTASIDARELADKDKQWNWTVTLEDKHGKNYIAGGNLMLIAKRDENSSRIDPIGDQSGVSGYLLSPKPDFSSKSHIYGKDQTIYMKAWSQDVSDAAISEAIWTLMSTSDNTQIVTRKLSNNNPESIGRLLMSRFVLPFEVVSILLLAALIGAIVISRKDS